MKKLENFFSGLYFSLPLQLLLTQFRRHKIVLVFFVIPVYLMSDPENSVYGVPYLFLAPEYLGEVNFWSMFLLGIGFGTFIAAYNIAIYILESYRYHFLAMESRPFFVFFLNNGIIPFFFLGYYTFVFLSFRWDVHREMANETWLMYGGWVCGLISIYAFLSAYFSSTNRSIEKYLGKRVVKKEGHRRAVIKRAKAGIVRKYRIDYYFVGPFKLEIPDTSSSVDFRSMVQILNQNHGNALFLELLMLVVIMLLGLNEENPYFQIPSGLSSLLICSIALMFVAAFAFWFRKIGALSLLLAIAAMVGLESSGVLDKRHQAFGMDYDVPPVEYSEKKLAEIADVNVVLGDYFETIRTLNQWKSDFHLFNPRWKKPKAVFICASGGGIRASYFTFRSLQTMDSLMNGTLMEKTRFMSGASGGMIGSAYYRELFYQKQRQMIQEDIYTKKWANSMPKYLLNRILFKGVTGTLLPNLKVQVGSRKYYSDRGYSLDHQLGVNLPELKGRRLGDYREAEASALIPMFVLAPVSINDGRKMYISSKPVSYLSRNLDEKNITGIEFQRLFKNHQPDSLLMLTALRMNASFPMITPFVRMPSEPVMEIIDAGIADNFGIQTAVKFLYVFREWFEQNTSGVLFIQIRDTESQNLIREGSGASFVGGIVNPLGAAYDAYARSSDIMSDEIVQLSNFWYQGKCELINIEYAPVDSAGIKASLSWHLTEEEIVNIEKSIHSPKTIHQFNKVVEYLKED